MADLGVSRQTIAGPTLMAAAKIPIAMPRVTGSQKSTNALATMTSGADAPNPPKNRQIMMVSMFVATATGIWKTPNQK
jgi:hypothetical protein